MVGPCNSAQEGKGEDHGEQGGDHQGRQHRPQQLTEYGLLRQRCIFEPAKEAGDGIAAAG